MKYRFDDVPGRVVETHERGSPLLTINNVRYCTL